MTNKEEKKTAREIIEQFFDNLESLEGMDKDNAKIIQTLWKEGKLGRDELLSELEKARTNSVRLQKLL